MYGISQSDFLGIKDDFSKLNNTLECVCHYLALLQTNKKPSDNVHVLLEIVNKQFEQTTQKLYDALKA